LLTIYYEGIKQGSHLQLATEFEAIRCTLFDSFSVPSDLEIGESVAAEFSDLPRPCEDSSKLIEHFSAPAMLSIAMITSNHLIIVVNCCAGIQTSLGLDWLF
jgi:hypothetical protein